MLFLHYLSVPGQLMVIVALAIYLQASMTPGLHVAAVPSLTLPSSKMEA